MCAHACTDGGGESSINDMKTLSWIQKILRCIEQILCPSVPLFRSFLLRLLLPQYVCLFTLPSDVYSEIFLQLFLSSNGERIMSTVVGLVFCLLNPLFSFYELTLLIKFSGLYCIMNLNQRWQIKITPFGVQNRIE